MTRSTEWEYHVLRPPRKETRKESDDPIEELDELGAAGWELTETIDYEGGGTKYLVMKRPVETGVDEDE